MRSGFELNCLQSQASGIVEYKEDTRRALLVIYPSATTAKRFVAMCEQPMPGMSCTVQSLSLDV